ncbi:MAG: FAD-dependent oxidoreductase [Elusimicrobia bacterium]|nr:FAD-dependent oxidoreductase [Elusimicrobiota bacterium]
MKTNTVIIGGGITGLSAAYHLKNKDFLLLEKENSVGGICGSVKTNNGFTYDYTGHLLHIKNKYAETFIKKLLKNNLVLKTRNSWIYSNGVFTRYPFQVNMFGLPEKIIMECIEGLIKAKLQMTRLVSDESERANHSPRFAGEAGKLRTTNFYDFCLRTFGEGISKYFMLPYNEKLWRTDLNKLTTDWMGNYIPRPSLQEAITGAFTDNKRKIGYNASFYYPKNGGIQALIDAIKKHIPDTKIKTNIEILSINTGTRIIKTNAGDIQYNKLISTIPLPELIKLIKNPPVEIAREANALKWTSVLNINIGINRKNLSDRHWIYFPEKGFIFYRAGFYNNFSKTLCPKGTSSLYIEVSYLPGSKTVKNRKILQKILSNLKTAKILKSTDKIVSECTLDIPYAYVIYDKKRNTALKTIQKYLTKHSIISIGRYGGWKYSTMEDAILDGREAVKWIK